MSRSPAKNGPRYRSTKVFCRAISRECHRPSEKIADGMHPTLPCSCGPRSRLQLPPRLRTYLPLLDTFPVQSPQRQTSRLPTPRLGRSPQREGVFFLPCKNIACPRPIRKPQLTSFIRDGAGPTAELQRWRDERMRYRGVCFGGGSVWQRIGNRQVSRQT
jgi:hypothetical protein